ncbi:DUF3892 domain-containing protein [Chryseobacterium sp. G0162]|jgi:hypothetical protein|uniref:DUF3892 domain-containing protein n=1 Tax=Chryseobacterium sp. G0162 TaxID=2487063 RepID=UPI000F4ED3C1|nr:DUF3892 domain-containing protein [Chryseobacterium sp. G0162]AZB10872.1 DUF3892 domain-containing protein [Chryseobacterium sp. G0162]
MAEFRISGIWLDSGGVITHYAIHTRKKNSKGDGYIIGLAEKYTKQAAVDLLLKQGNIAKTYLWNYNKRIWEAGAEVQVISGKPLFLKSNPDSTERDNLLHLINYGYIFK